MLLIMVLEIPGSDFLKANYKTKNIKEISNVL